MGQVKESVAKRFTETSLAEVGNMVWGTIDAANTKHGPLTRDHGRALHILAEEVGEAHSAYLGMTRIKPSNRKNALINELAQVAGTAMLIIKNLMEDEGLDG